MTLVRRHRRFQQRWLPRTRQRILTHESARTTKLYARTSDTIFLAEIEGIMI